MLKLPIILTIDPKSGFKLVGQLEIRIKISSSVFQLAMLNGYEPEEIQNIVSQKLAAVNDLVADLMDVI